MNWLDVLLLLIIGGYTWVGLRSGLIGGLARLLGVLLGLAAAFNLYRPLSDMVNLKWNLVGVIGKWFPFSSPGAGGRLPGADGLFMPGVPQAGGGLLQAPKGSLFGLQGLGDSISGLLASGILDILCFILIYLVVSKGVFILGALVAKLSRLFFLGPVDRLGGAALGAVKGVILALVVVALGNSLQVPAAYISGGQGPNWISLALQKSVLVPYLVKALVVVNLKFPGWSI